MHSTFIFSTLFLLASTTTALTPSHPRAGLLKRDTELVCPSNIGFRDSTVCAADDGSTVCVASGDDTCCQLPKGNTPYTCDFFNAPYCCGTDKPRCGMDETCKDREGEASKTPIQGASPVYMLTVLQVRVFTAESVVLPTAVTVQPGTSTKGAFATNAAIDAMQTVTGEKGPGATGAADVLGVRVQHEMVVVVVAAMALL